jgi:hypothetical protein
LIPPKFLALAILRWKGGQKTIGVEEFPQLKGAKKGEDTSYVADTIKRRGRGPAKSIPGEVD